MKHDSLQTKNDLSLPFSEEPNILLYEFNLWKHPLFFISKSAEGSNQVIDVRFKTDNGDGYWRVAPSVDYGAGGQFEDLTLIIINKIINEMPRPIENPINIGPLSRILQLMGYSNSEGSLGGKAYARLKLAIRRIASLTISSKYAFYDKERGRHLAGADGVFHIFDSCLFVGEETSDRIKAESNLIWLNNTLLKSLNRRYVGPIDLDFYQNLKPLSRAIFKMLQIVFFATKGTNLPAQFRYSTLCEKTTITRQKKLYIAKSVMNPAHQELMSTGYIERFEWIKIKGVKDDWKLYYWPGPRAHSYTALHIPVKGIHWLTDTQGEHPQKEPPQEIEQEMPTLFDMLGSGADIADPDKKTIDNETRELLISRCIDFYKDHFRQTHGNNPIIKQDKDRTLMGDLIDNGYSEQDICSLLTLYLADKDNEFIMQSGYSLPVFKSVLNTFVIRLSQRRKRARKASDEKDEDKKKPKDPWDGISKDDIQKATKGIFK